MEREDAAIGRNGGNVREAVPIIDVVEAREVAAGVAIVNIVDNDIEFELSRCKVAPTIAWSSSNEKSSVFAFDPDFDFGANLLSTLSFGEGRNRTPTGSSKYVSVVFSASAVVVEFGLSTSDQLLLLQVSICQLEHSDASM